MYEIEKTCTKLLIIKTGKSIATVKASKWKPQFMFNHSESIHLNRWMETGTLLIPTSIKANTAKNVEITTHNVVINCAPLLPTLLPKKPATILPNKGKKIILKYIIYIRSLRFLFNTDLPLFIFKKYIGVGNTCT